MTPTAITFLALSATVIWGGLVASILRLRHDARVTANESTSDESAD